MKHKFSTSDIRNLFLRADSCIHQTPGLFRETRDWFDSYTQIDAWRQRQRNIIKQLEKEIDTGLSERGRKRDIEIIRDRMEDSPTFHLLSCEAWATIAPKEREKRFPLKIIYLFWLLHRRLFGVSKYETYPFRDIWDNSSNPEYEDEAARSAIFDANPENYQIVKKALDAICSQNGDPKADDECTHSVNFTSVIWYRHKYTFNDTQAKVVKLLWDAWRDPTKVGVIERDIGAVIETFAKQYRLVDTFYSKGKYHEAWGVMIKRTGKGIYALCKP